MAATTQVPNPLAIFCITPFLDHCSQLGSSGIAVLWSDTDDGLPPRSALFDGSKTFSNMFEVEYLGIYDRLYFPGFEQPIQRRREIG